MCEEKELHRDILNKIFVPIAPIYTDQYELEQIWDAVNDVIRGACFNISKYVEVVNLYGFDSRDMEMVKNYEEELHDALNVMQHPLRLSIRDRIQLIWLDRML